MVGVTTTRTRRIRTRRTTLNYVRNALLVIILQTTDEEEDSSSTTSSTRDVETGSFIGVSTTRTSSVICLPIIVEHTDCLLLLSNIASYA